MTRGPHAGIVVLVASVLLLTGCSRELGGSSAGSVGVNTSPAAARSKLEALAQDPCYTAADPSRTWPVCGRWVEEATSTARTATGARPGDTALAQATTRVSAARDAFVARGCVATGAPGGPVDGAACVSALLAARDGVRALEAALRTA